ncbi:helix-turn-helix domain-containing protein [Anoxynatronum buryatiense]|uniref:Transcriptional regulator, contains XRE-family HTH domain n=1 Tax=Anoxynatronum buryatiense TaxID=489973 RepID=A0AA45WSR2_9CLOT|nr:helix-turn-helix transcriptional regulator [Anoxynatronum buryatiense]SMP38376.1 Transcriptional regulator, contains XRE-family HTH domain [Anoxynatronum buryatiense]
MEILNRIQALLREKGMTIAELERKANIGNGVIRRWNNSVPTADKLQRVAEVLGTTIDYLFNGENEADSKALFIGREASELTDEQREIITSMIRQMKAKNQN